MSIVLGSALDSSTPDWNFCERGRECPVSQSYAVAAQLHVLGFLGGDCVLERGRRLLCDVPIPSSKT